MVIFTLDKVCKPKEEGGLNLRRAKDLNLPFMIKLAWGLVNRPEALWVKVICSKYGYQDKIIPDVQRKQQCSNAWRGIVFVWGRFKQNLIWRIGDGKQARFWVDHWIPGVHKLEDLAVVDIDADESGKWVADCADGRGEWNWENIRSSLTEDCLGLFHSVKAPEDNLGRDSVAWLHSSTGDFTMKSAYNCLKEEEEGLSSNLFKAVWKVKAPHLIQQFLWLISNNALLTNQA